ncbi:MAG: hypothetical protein JNM69_15885 [Archangium sp.]|nr:hypothetical protein [Archangium sp.]
MFLSAYLAVVLSQPVPEGFVPENTADKTAFAVKADRSGYSFDWSDSEDRLRGTLSPSELSSGDPLTISVALGSFAGGDFEGPITLGLEQVDGDWKALETVPAPKTEPRVWNATFTPPASGRYAVKATFRSSRQKSVRGVIEVGMGRVSATVGLGVGIGAILLAVVYGLFILFGKKDGATSEAPGPPPTA